MASSRPNHRPIEFGGPLGLLVNEVYGDTEAFGEAIGVSARTIRRWAAGQGHPSPPAAKLLLAIGAKHGIPEADWQPVFEGQGSHS